MDVKQFVKGTLVLLFLVVFSAATQAQKNIYIPGSNIDLWSGCDTSAVAIKQDDNGFLEALIANHDWVCLSVDFNETDLTEFEVFEIKLKTEYKDSLIQALLMFAFKDVNGYRNVDQEERIFNINIDSNYTDIIVPLDRENIQRFFPREGAVDAKRINTVLLYFRFDTFITEKQLVKVLIESVRFY